MIRLQIKEKDLDYSYVEINPYEVDERLPGAILREHVSPEERFLGKMHSRAPNFRDLSWFDTCLGP